jgi:hypothetical protein
MIPAHEEELAVLKSVIYASLFDYPLTLEQLHHSLIGVRTDCQTILSWWRASALLQSSVEYRDGLFFPIGRRDLIDTRARREAVSRDMLDRDRRVLAMTARLPFIRMVALSGSLAHLNAEGSADLDLFVITAPNRVWSVTLAMLVLSRLFGWRKHICLNYVISERTMKIVPEDLFTANQIIHLRPVFGQRVFDRFVKTNGFVRSHYPNFELPGAGLPALRNAKTSAPQNLKVLVERLLSCGPAQIAERIARMIYGRHLRSKASAWQSRAEVRLEAECLKLHTSSHRVITLRKFDDAMAAAIEREAVTAAVPR